MMTKILVIDDIPDEYKDYQLKATFTLWKIQDGVLQEIGIHGCDFLKEMPKKLDEHEYYIKYRDAKIPCGDWIEEVDGYNRCIDEILGDEE